MTVDKLWDVVKKLKRETSLEKTCYTYKNDLYMDPNIIASQVSVFENQLGINSSELRFENMTGKDLQTAAEMFLYLNMCPGEYNKEIPVGPLQKWFITWFTFYEDLLKKQSPDIILLTLNRIMKKTNDNAFEGMFFKRITNALKLKNEEIQSLLPGAERKIFSMGNSISLNNSQLEGM